MVWTLVRSIAATLAAALLILLLAVAVMRRDHRVELVATFAHTPPTAVWRVLTDHAAESTWIPAFGAVERLPDNEGRPVWRIRTPEGAPFSTLMTIAARDAERYERLLLRDDQPRNQPWDGRWVFELTPAGPGTTLRITEYGWTGGFLFFISQRIVGSPDAFLRYYLQRMGTVLKDEPDVQVLRSH